MKVIGKHTRLNPDVPIEDNTVYEVHYTLTYIPSFAEGLVSNYIINYQGRNPNIQILYWELIPNKLKIQFKKVPGSGIQTTGIPVIVTVGVIAMSLMAVFIGFGISMSYLAKIEPVSKDIASGMRSLSLIVLSIVGAYAIYTFKGGGLDTDG